MIGYIFLFVLVSLIALLLVPISVIIICEESGEVSVKYNWLFIKGSIFPLPAKSTKAKKTKSKPKKSKKKPKEEKEKDTDDYISLIFDILKNIKNPVKALLKTVNIKIEHFALYINAADSAQTAISYGKTSAVIWSAYAVLCSVFTVKAKSMVVYPDFLGEKSRLSAKISVSIMPIITVIPSVWMIINALKAIIKHKGREKNERKAT